MQANARMKENEMGEYVGEKIARHASENGVLVGKTEPCAETKFSWWQVYRVDHELIACVFANGACVCGERISDAELPLYVEGE